MMSRFLRIPAALFPYLTVATLLLILFDKEEDAAATAPVVLYIGIPAAFAVCMLCAVLATILTAIGKGTAKEAARAVMIIKLVQIPAYIAIFVTGFFLSAFIFVFAIPLLLFLWLIDCATILQTGILGIGSALAARREGKMISAEIILCAVIQFVFVVDVFAAIWLYLRVSSARKDPSLSEVL